MQTSFSKKSFTESIGYGPIIIPPLIIAIAFCLSFTMFESHVATPKGPIPSSQTKPVTPVIGGTVSANGADALQPISPLQPEAIAAPPPTITKTAASATAAGTSASQQAAAPTGEAQSKVTDTTLPAVQSVTASKDNTVFKGVANALKAHLSIR